jgi:hypothetical protein
MALTYVNQIGADGGIMQSAPNIGISEANLVWAQDILMDRPGFIRRRGPLVEKTIAGSLNPGEMIAGVTSTNTTNGEWYLCVLATDNVSSRFIFFNSDGNLEGWSWLPFKMPNGSYRFENTDTQNETVRLNNPMTMFVGKPALTAGSFLSVFTRYGVPTFSDTSQYARFQSLYYWRGGHGSDCSLSLCDIAVETVGSLTNNTQWSRTITTTGSLTTSVTGSGETPRITPGMFVFDTNGDAAYQCIGVVRSVDSETSPTSIVLDKRPMLGHSGAFNATTNVVSAVSDTTLKFRNVRGFQHVHGRGLITITSGDVVTSGIEGSGADGHFSSAKINETSDEWYVYRNSDSALVGKVKWDGATSNTQFTLTSGAVKLSLTSDEYAMVKKQTTLSSDNNLTSLGSSRWAFESAPYYQPRLSGKVDDSAAGIAYADSVRSEKDAAGYFTATYAGLQWYGSLGKSSYENQIVFSSYHDPEAVDLSPDAADSIVIPGTNIMRGMATSNSGLVIFMSDNTYILRGNDRSNFSLEVLYPEGCLSAGSIVEIGGGVIWASNSGIMYFDGSTVRNMSKDMLGTYYYDGVKHFDANADRIYSFVYKNYLFVHFTKWESSYSFTKFEPVYVNPAAGDLEGQTITYNNVAYPPSTYTSYGFSWEDMVSRKAALTYDSIKNYIKTLTMAIYMPTGSMTTLSNFEFTGAAFLDAVNAGVLSDLNYDKAWVSVNARKERNSTAEFIAGKPSNPVTSVSEVTGTVTVTYTTAASDAFENGDLVDLVDRNDDPIVSSITIGSLTSVLTDTSTTSSSSVAIGTGTKTFTFNSAIGYTLGQRIRVISSANSANFVEGAITTIASNVVTIDSNLIGGSGTISSWIVKRADSKTFTYTGTLPVGVVGVVKPEYVTSNHGHFVGIDAMLDIESNGYDDFITVASRYPGPDLYFQTKIYTVGDPVIKKWFQRIMVSMLIKGGAIRIDMLDYENNDYIDTQVKERNWVLLPEFLYAWSESERFLAAETNQNPASWSSVFALNTTWDDLFFPAFERRTKRFSLRTNALGYQFYQLNRWKQQDAASAAVSKPTRVETDAWSIGFKALRPGRQ